MDLPENTYLDLTEVVQSVNRALSTRSNSAQIMLRSRPILYEVNSGDTGYGIARKAGIPFFLIEQENPDIDLSILSPGDVVTLPSRDVTLPIQVISNKRIIVDLETQTLAAYEDDELKEDDESKSDVKNIVTTMKDEDSEIKSEMTRYYNGVLPSSNYPAFNESRVNLIE